MQRVEYNSGSWRRQLHCFVAGCRIFTAGKTPCGDLPTGSALNDLYASVRQRLNTSRKPPCSFRSVHILKTNLLSKVIGFAKLSSPIADHGELSDGELDKRSLTDDDSDIAPSSSVVSRAINGDKLSGGLSTPRPHLPPDSRVGPVADVNGLGWPGKACFCTAWLHELTIPSVVCDLHSQVHPRQVDRDPR